MFVCVSFCLFDAFADLAGSEVVDAGRSTLTKTNVCCLSWRACCDCDGRSRLNPPHPLRTLSAGQAELGLLLVGSQGVGQVALVRIRGTTVAAPAAERESDDEVGTWQCRRGCNWEQSRFRQS